MSARYVQPRLAHRRRWNIAGQVQGVGFRPFVYRIARELRLRGFVRNDPAGVIVEAQAAGDVLDQFEAMLVERRPALASIDRLSCVDVPLRSDEMEFVIETSTACGDTVAEVTVDTATCPDCVGELLDPANRRFGYGLINCTNCGPRFTIIRQVPYDRPNTTMAGFRMCAACAEEYTNPADRRFHAQPVACHECGPKVELVSAKGEAIEGDPIEGAVERLLAGRILALKGLGGFHLAVRADSPAAVARLRQNKHRDRKPFAIMVRSIVEARRLVELSEAAEAAMLSPACPIVLARRKPEIPVAADVAPGNHRLGVMLPYTPLQHLICSALSTQNSELPLVMTSANVCDEPLVTDNAEAVERLGGICDAILWHDRPIERPVDDSVVIDMGEACLAHAGARRAGQAPPLPIRRARGYVPQAIRLPVDGGMGLCVGGELKNTVAVVNGQRAILSHHMGDLTHTKAYACFHKAIDDMMRLFAVRPTWIAHDLHPMYLSTVAAKQIAGDLDAELIGIQHHHAHAAAVMAEHGVTEKVLAIVCDGVGYGTDGTMWGGELFAADLCGCERLAHLEPLILPGGDAAAKDCRRCGLALLRQAFGEGFDRHPAARRLIPDEAERAILSNMIRRNFNCATTSGAGRVFDGVAALLDVCSRNSFEAEAAMRLESLAATVSSDERDEILFTLRDGQPMRIDFAPLVRAILERLDAGHDIADLAALFHSQLARAWEAAVERAAEKTGLSTVALSGGVFCNEILTKLLSRRLESRGLRVLRHRQVPPNDGGLALGQAAIAAMRKTN